MTIEHQAAPRGTVISLEPAEVVLRARRMANHPHTSRYDDTLPDAPEGYYRLKYPNGGTDPTAPDNFARWSKPGSKFENVTGDCVSLSAWASGFDRFQERRGSHLQGGAINCDFMVRDARGRALCFELLPRPYAGCIVVYPSLPDGEDDDDERDGAGHTGIVISTPIEWDPAERDCWARLGVIDCAGRSGLAVQYTTGLTWWGSRKDKSGKAVAKGSIFVRSIMRP